MDKVEHLVNRIISGTIRCRIKGFSNEVMTLLLRYPTRYYRYIANEIYNEIYEEALYYGMYTDNDLKFFLLENELWLPEHEEKLSSLQKDIEELKLRMYEASFNSQVLDSAKKVLRAAKNDLQSLYEKKFSYNHLSASGFAEIERNKFLIGMSLYSTNEVQFWDEDSYWSSPAFILEQVLTIHKENRISETEYRWLARNEPWRSYWLSRKSEGQLFGIAPVDMTEEQRSLVVWSSIYDNVNEHPEQPPQYVIDDDDVLDGWFISQRKKREKELNRSAADQLISNEKIRNSGEVFIPASSQADLQRINSLNDAEADIIKKQRMNYLNKHGGTISEAQMPDTKTEIRRKRNEMYRDFVKGTNH
jgi:hypothetical protein